MTINELEQGLRNLISSEPAALSGNLGEVIRGVMGVAEAYRNYIFHVQSYPVQDVFKFSLLSETSKLENNIAGLACAMLQERGINLLLYIPQNMSPYTGQFASPNYNLAMGQMLFNPSINLGAMPNANFNLSQMPNTNPMFAKQNSILQNMGQPVLNNSKSKPKASSSYPGYQPTGKPTFASNAKSDKVLDENFADDSSKSAEVNNNRNEKSSVEINFNNEAQEDKTSQDINPESAENTQSPAEIFMGNVEGSSSDKAAGRDYLLELLKK